MLGSPCYYAHAFLWRETVITVTVGQCRLETAFWVWWTCWVQYWAVLSSGLAVYLYNTQFTKWIRTHAECKNCCTGSDQRSVYPRIQSPGVAFGQGRTGIYVNMIPPLSSLFCSNYFQFRKYFDSAVFCQFGKMPSHIPVILWEVFLSIAGGTLSFCFGCLWLLPASSEMGPGSCMTRDNEQLIREPGKGFSPRGWSGTGRGSSVQWSQYSCLWIRKQGLEQQNQLSFFTICLFFAIEIQTNLVCFLNRSEENKKQDKNKKKLALLLPIGSEQSKPENLLTSLKVSEIFGFSYGGRKKFGSCMMKSYYCRNNMTYWKAFRLKNESFLWYLYLFPISKENHAEYYFSNVVFSGKINIKF